METFTQIKMTTFKQFIVEAAAGKNPEYVDVSVKDAIALLNTYCKNALWMLEENRPIWRGDVNIKFPKSKFKVVDTEATQRVSQNTSNYYTIILDNHPDRQNFPKRSRSFIASTDRYYAHGYGGGWAGGALFAVIPSDSAKIGFVNKEDMWNTRITLFGYRISLTDANCFFENIFEGDDDIYIDDFKIFDKLLKNNDNEAIEKFENALGCFKKADSRSTVKKYKDHFLEEVFKAYSAEATGHSVHTSSNMPHDEKSEVWVGGKVVLIEQAMWKKLVEAYHGK